MLPWYGSLAAEAISSLESRVLPAAGAAEEEGERGTISGVCRREILYRYELCRYVRAAAFGPIGTPQ